MIFLSSLSLNHVKLPLKRVIAQVTNLRHSSLRIFDRIRTMFNFLRMWWLIYRMNDETIRMSALEVRKAKDGGTFDGSRIPTFAYPLDPFLEKLSESSFFGFRNKAQQGKRAEKDRRILQEARKRGYVEIVTPQGKSEPYVNVLPEGSYFASYTVGANEFLKEFKVFNALLVSIFLFLAANEIFGLIDFLSSLLSKLMS